MVQRPDESSKDISVAKDKDPTNNPVVQASATNWWPWASSRSPQCGLALWMSSLSLDQSSALCCIYYLFLSVLGLRCSAGVSVAAVPFAVEQAPGRAGPGLVVPQLQHRLGSRGPRA